MFPLVNLYYFNLIRWQCNAEYKTSNVCNQAMQVPWDCMLSEMIKIQNRHTNESTNEGNVKPTMLKLKKKKNPPVETQPY